MLAATVTTANAAVTAAVNTTAKIYQKCLPAHCSTKTCVGADQEQQMTLLYSAHLHLRWYLLCATVLCKDPMTSADSTESKKLCSNRHSHEASILSERPLSFPTRSVCRQTSDLSGTASPEVLTSQLMRSKQSDHSGGRHRRSCCPRCSPSNTNH